MRNYNKTFPAIRERFVCIGHLADYLGRSETYCSVRLQKKAEFSPAEKIALEVACGVPWEVIECS